MNAENGFPAEELLELLLEGLADDIIVENILLMRIQACDSNVEVLNVNGR